MRQGSAAADLTGASVYFIWRHKKTGVRGCEPFEEIDESLGQFMAYYPAAMCEEEGVVEAQCIVSWDDKAISTRAFTIHVEPVLIGGTESEDGFTLFVETIKRYEDVIGITTDAADAANEAAEAADDAAGSASAIAAAIQAASQRGDYDGTDGFSPIATFTQTAEGATISITDANGTTTANVAKGAKGDKGDTGEQGSKGDKGNTGAQGPQGPAGADGTTFTPVSPLSHSNGELSVDLSAYQTVTTRLGRLIALTEAANTTEGSSYNAGVQYADVQVGDFVWDKKTDRLGKVTSLANNRTTIEGVLELQKFRALIPTTTLDAAEGRTGSGTVDVDKHAVRAETLILNTTSGNLMKVTSNVNKPWSGSTATVSVLGLGCVFGGGASYTAQSPLDITNGVISIDLSGYAALTGATFTGAVSGITPTANARFATKKYVDDAIAALDDLSGVSF